MPCSRCHRVGHNIRTCPQITITYVPRNSNSLAQNENAPPNHISNSTVYDTKECCICMEEITPTNRCVTQCGHQFCLSCMFQMIDASPRCSISCPICRADIHKFKRNQISISYRRLPRLNTRIGLVTRTYFGASTIGNLKNILSISGLNQLIDGLNVLTKSAIRSRFEGFLEGVCRQHLRNVNNNIMRYLGNRQ
jgi:hypothetical protein